MGLKDVLVLALGCGYEPPWKSWSEILKPAPLGPKNSMPAPLLAKEEYLPKFDIYNCATALHKCGLSARDDELAARQIQSDPNFVRLFSTAKKQTLSQAGGREVAGNHRSGGNLKGWNAFFLPFGVQVWRWLLLSLMNANTSSNSFSNTNTNTNANTDSDTNASATFGQGLGNKFFFSVVASGATGG